MKKLISVLLATVMVLSTMVMLVPIASAEVDVKTDNAGTTGKVYYEQNFDDPALANLVDKDLAAALGWNSPNPQATMWMENGKIRIFTQYTPSGVYPATENRWAGGYNTGILFQNPDIVRNTMVAEWTFKYNRHAAGEDVTVTLADGTKKTVKADGQGGYQGSSFHYTGTNALGAPDTALVRVNQGGNSWQNLTKAPDSATTNTIYWKTTTFEQVYPMAEGDTCVLEYWNNPVATESEAARTSTTMNREYSMKVVVEPWAHRVYAFVDGELWIAMNIPNNTDKYSINDWGRMLTDAIALNVKPGVDVTMDNFKFYEYVPNLTISEMMVNGSKANATGKYQWIEITNPSDAPVNVYDYAIHVNNMPIANNRTYTIGDDTDNGTNAWNIGAGSTLGYFTPGAKTLGEEVFDSPAYEDGVLQPGESAIVLLPETAMAGGISVTDEAFGAYLTSLGMPEGTKTFVCENESDYPFTIGVLANESAAIQIVKATNTATDGGYAPVADCKGKYAEYAPAYAECTALVTGKIHSSGTNWYGLKCQTSGAGTSNWPANAHSLATNISYALAEDKSYEINYSGWVNGYAVQNTYFDHTNIKWGFPKYGPNETRLNGNGADVYATPGYVPVDCRRAIDVDVNGTLMAGALLTDFSTTVTAPEAEEGYVIHQYVDGVLVNENVTAGSTVTVAYDADEMTNAAHSVMFIYAEDLHEHEYGKWTNYDTNQHAQTCVICGDTVYAGHEWNAGTQTTPPTCTEEGVLLRTCTACDATRTERIAPIGHAWNNGVITTDPTCTEYGVKTFTCGNCGDTYTERIDPIGHAWGAWTELNATQHKRVCANGGCEEILIHTWDDGRTTTEPTCTEAGVMTYTCADCGATKTEVIAPLGHAWGAWTELDDDRHTRSCIVCSETLSAPHTWSNNTCTDCGLEKEIPVVSATMTVESKTVRVGDTVTLNVDLGENPGIAGVILTLTYNKDALKLLNVENGSIFSTMTDGINVVLSQNSGNATANGTVLTLTFETLAEGSFEIGMIIRESANVDMETVEIGVIPGTLEVIDFLYGDADGNNVVNLRDVILLNQYLANYDYDTGMSTVAVQPGADANYDGNINLRDVILLNQYLANYDYDTGTSSVVLGPQ